VISTHFLGGQPLKGGVAIMSNIDDSAFKQDMAQAQQSSPLELREMIFALAAVVLLVAVARSGRT